MDSVIFNLIMDLAKVMVQIVTTVILTSSLEMVFVMLQIMLAHVILMVETALNSTRCILIAR